MTEPVSSDPGHRGAFADPNRPPENEMRIGISGSFALALAGDLIASHPIAPLADSMPAFKATLDILHRANLCCGNLETNLFDIGRFSGYPYCWDDDIPLLGTAPVAKDLVSLGFDMLARANNHALDWGIEGMRETTRLLDAAGLVHAGTGENLGLARRAAYAQTPQGRVAIISAATTYRPTTEALQPHGATPGRPGINPIRLHQIDILPPDDLALLRKLQQESAPEQGVFRLFGRRFEQGAARGYLHDIDPVDLAEFLRELRHGKQNADLLVAMIHAHEVGRDGYPEPPSPALRRLAHAAVDAGADVVSFSGIHHVGPVDLYRDRPIFYGLGNFLWSDIQEFLPSETWNRNRDLAAAAFDVPDRATATDLNSAVNAGYYGRQEVFETVLPVVRFDDGRFVEAILHPIDLGYGDALTRSGIPRLAGPAQANRILRRISGASASFGCEHEFEIVGSVGIMRQVPQ